MGAGVSRGVESTEVMRRATGSRVLSPYIFVWRFVFGGAAKNLAVVLLLSIFSRGNIVTNQRTALRADLKAAWQAVIECKYDMRLIDSEASLQVHFAAALLNQFRCESRMRRIFVEPSVRVESPKIYKKPDLLICNKDSIIGMVELKYVPRGRPTYMKDLETLNVLAEHRLKFTVSNDRYLGPYKGAREYILAKDAVLCWAAVYTGAKVASPPFESAEKRSNFLALHALTSEKHSAHIPI